MRFALTKTAGGGTRGINSSLVTHFEADEKGAVLHTMGGGQISLTSADWQAIKPEFVGEPPAAPEAVAQ